MLVLFGLKGWRVGYKDWISVVVYSCGGLWLMWSNIVSDFN